MKKLFSFFITLISVFVFSQFAEIKKIDKKFEQKYSEIRKKYKKVHNAEREKEEAKLYEEQAIEYENAIAEFQKNEEKIDVKTLSTDNWSKPINFEGGIGAFRKLFAENFDISILSGNSGTVKSEVKFIVDEKGNVLNISANGSDKFFNQIAVLTMFRIKDKGKWTPAEIDGKPVKSAFRFPITMNFE
ncbi:hypothetical protein GCM10010992_11150 [Cloacibacterium rupense]|uniref:TonB C-terminal domain-containing protein n=1 Tax=Cloacibacterium rupense TaxID=517423 RepID=A0ABQ2NIG5_9FLAO|nr:hypothetical protein [Cloacibacterium rupense]GGP03300.1 hypothetical protein GCM10010992_11150 [Cloacibacterium rupense]